jgi:hypothetical protein
LGCNRLSIDIMVARWLMAGSLLLMSLMPGCNSDAVAPRGSVGPESLTVAFDAFPDTAPVGGSLDIGATAYNATSRVVFFRWASGACGLTVRVYQGAVEASLPAPPVCRGSGAETMAPGKSTVMGMLIGAGWPRGTYRVHAQVEAVDGRSPAIERTVVVP